MAACSTRCAIAPWEAGYPLTDAMASPSSRKSGRGSGATDRSAIAPGVRSCARNSISNVSSATESAPPDTATPTRIPARSSRRSRTLVNNSWEIVERTIRTESPPCLQMVAAKERKLTPSLNLKRALHRGAQGDFFGLRYRRRRRRIFRLS